MTADDVCRIKKAYAVVSNYRDKLVQVFFFGHTVNLCSDDLSAGRLNTQIGTDMQKNIRAAAVQMISSTDPDANIDTMKCLVRQAAEQGADWVLLPEYWPLMGCKDTDKLAFAEPLVGSNFSETCHTGFGETRYARFGETRYARFGETRYARFGETRYARFQTTLSETAAECGVVLFGGTIPLQSPDAGKVMNTMLVYDRDGTQIGLYHKMHLFGFSGLGERYAEADTISAGGDVPKLTADGVPLAAGVCYDLRFPEFFRAQQPFDVLLLPAAFTYTTGKAHWELLLRARAVENQCYVIASAQGGEHESGRRTFGHSMIIDPWGEILDVLPEGEGIVIADLDAARLQSVRTRLPALKHRLL